MANGGSGSWSFAAGGAGGGGIVSAGGGGGSASISSTGVIGGSSFSRAMSEEEIKKLKAELAQHRKAQVILPDGYDSEVRVSTIDSADHILVGDGREVRLPREIFQALINAAGGCVVLDAADILNADSTSTETVEVVKYADPLKIVFRVVERR